MKGNENIIGTLNQLLADELTAINQYMLHAELCENWGYEKLHKAIEKQAFDEMHHAEWLIQRIIFFDSIPTVSKLNPVRVGKTVPEILNNDLEDELGAVGSYNNAIRQAHDVNDQATVELLTTILKMEEGHVDWGETQQDQIEQFGLERYLSNQAEE
jgi:bacterioferritin